MKSFTEEFHSFNGRSRVSCLEWNSKIESFLKQSLGSLGSLDTSVQQGFADRDIENSKSRKSRCFDRSNLGTKTSETLENQSLAPETKAGPAFRDFRDFRDVISNDSEKFDPDSERAPGIANVLRPADDHSSKSCRQTTF